MSTILNSRGMLVGIGLMAALSVAACTTHPAGNAASARSSQSATPAPSAATIPAAAVTTSPPAAAPSGTPGGVQNLVITSAEKSELAAVYVADYVAFTGKPASNLGDPVATPDSAYYAYDTVTDTYWALVDYEPTAPVMDPTAYMDGSSFGLFKKVGSGAWQVNVGGEPVPCAEIRFFPKAVLHAWSLPTTPPAGLTC